MVTPPAEPVQPPTLREIAAQGSAPRKPAEKPR